MTGMFRPVTETAISAAFIFGMMLALWGSLKLTLARSLNLNEGRVGALLLVFNLALAPMMILSGVLIDVWGVRPVLILSSAATAAAVFALSYAPAVPRAFGAVLLGGLGAAGLCTGSVVLMPEAFFPHEPTPSLNAGIMFMALGALITPAFVDVAIRLIGYRRALAILALACLVPGVLGALAGREDLPTGSGEPLEVFSQNTLWLAALVLALYSPLEASISFWATTYLTERGSGEGRAAWLLSGFWGAFLVSRLVVAVLMHERYIRPEWSEWVLVIFAMLAAVILGNMAGTVGTARAGRGLLLLGFCLGPIFPTLVGMVFDRISQAEIHADGTAFGMLFAAGSFGSALLAPVIAASVRRRTMQSALRIPMFGALLLTALALVFGLAG
jgi:fucose permease